MNKTCVAGRHHPQKDEDGDTVCIACRLVIRIGPLGINGYSYGELIGYVSSLGCIDASVYDADELPPEPFSLDDEGEAAEAVAAA